jgi:hypothetical protein
VLCLITRSGLDCVTSLSTCSILSSYRQNIVAIALASFHPMPLIWAKMGAGSPTFSRQGRMISSASSERLRQRPE